MLRLAAEKGRRLCLEAFRLKGLSEVDATVCADAVMFATLRGLDSHGIVSILPAICNSIAVGRVDPTSPIQEVKPLLLKGNGAAGPVIGARTMGRAIDVAEQNGVGVAVAFNCNHFGAASYYASLAVDRGMVGVCACNAAPNVAPFGGARGLHGTNPIAYAAPGGQEPPIVLDIATSAAAQGQITKAARRGQTIPIGWAIDAEGRPTTDPKQSRSLLPFGGHKGYGIGILVDILTGALAASTIGQGVRQQDVDREHAGQSYFMLALDPDAFGGLEAFRERIDQLSRDVHSVPPAEGFAEVLLPGELEWREERRRRADGIPLYDEDWTALVQGLARAGLPAEELAGRYAPEAG
jgi:ureidoglycolate dehydrogenase (NAD+)